MNNMETITRRLAEEHDAKIRATWPEYMIQANHKIIDLILANQARALIPNAVTTKDAK